MRWSGLPQGAALFDTLVDFQPQSFAAPLRALGGEWERRSLSIVRRPGLPLSLSVAGEARLRMRMDFDACWAAPGCIPSCTCSRPARTREGATPFHRPEGETHAA